MHTSKFVLLSIDAMCQCYQLCDVFKLFNCLRAIKDYSINDVCVWVCVCDSVNPVTYDSTS